MSSISGMSNREAVGESTMSDTTKQTLSFCRPNSGVIPVGLVSGWVIAGVSAGEPRRVGGSQGKRSTRSRITDAGDGDGGGGLTTVAAADVPGSPRAPGFLVGLDSEDP